MAGIYILAVSDYILHLIPAPKGKEIHSSLC